MFWNSENRRNFRNLLKQGCHKTWKVREFGFTWKVSEKSVKFVRSQGKCEFSKSHGKVREFYSELRKCGDYYVANYESTIWITWNVINCCQLIEKINEIRYRFNWFGLEIHQTIFFPENSKEATFYKASSTMLFHVIFCANRLELKLPLCFNCLCNQVM